MSEYEIMRLRDNIARIDREIEQKTPKIAAQRGSIEAYNSLCVLPQLFERRNLLYQKLKEVMENNSQSKEYYATICEFYLKYNASDYISPQATGIIEGFQRWTDENGDEYEIFQGYRCIEYGLIARIGELSDDALQLFQKEICRRGLSLYFEKDRCITVAPRIVCCTTGCKPQWSGDNSITFPYKNYVKRKDNLRHDPTKHPKIAVWLREYKQPSLKEQFDLDQKLVYGDALLQHPEITPEKAIDTFTRGILKTCRDVASKIRQSESVLKREEAMERVTNRVIGSMLSDRISKSEANEKQRNPDGWEKTQAIQQAMKDIARKNPGLSGFEISEIFNQQVACNSPSNETPTTDNIAEQSPIQPVELPVVPQVPQATAIEQTLTKSKAGRKSATQEEIEKDIEIVEGWKTAKSDKLTKKEYAKSRGMLEKDVEAALDRERKREKRSQPK